MPILKYCASALLISSLLFGCATVEQTSVQGSTATSVAADPIQPQSQPDPDLSGKRLHIAAVGDIMLGTDFPRNILPDDDGVSFLKAVTPVLQNADVTFGNLEGVLIDGGEPVKKCSNPNACYLFRSPTRYATHLATAGFDVMSLANNHARDFGEEGRDSSAQALEAAGIHVAGGQGSVASWIQNELGIAVIAFSPTRGSWNLLDIDLATWAVRGLARRHDIVIVSFHGGAEGFAGAERLSNGMEIAYGEKRGEVIRFSRAVIDAGADLVLGHGPHVPRAMEIYNDRLIAYSLGNFATYYGISVTGAKGYAPIVMATLDGEGRFVGGDIYSNIQIRPGGPQPDEQERALNMMRELTLLDFPDGQLGFGNAGALTIKR